MGVQGGNVGQEQIKEHLTRFLRNMFGFTLFNSPPSLYMQIVGCRLYFVQLVVLLQSVF